MTSSQDQLFVVFGLLYGCGALIELLIRVSQGLPQPVPPFLARNAFCSVVLQPAVFFLLPALLWPFVIAHRILGPVVAVIRECCCCYCGRKEADDGSFRDDDSTASGNSMEFSMRNRRGSTMDVLEKGGVARGDSPRSCDTRVSSP